MSNFKKGFLALTADHCNSSLIPFMTADPDGGLTIHALALSASEALAYIRRSVRSTQTWAFALDRWCKPNQDTTRGSVMTWLVVEAGVPSVGVIEYRAW